VKLEGERYRIHREFKVHKVILLISRLRDIVDLTGVVPARDLLPDMQDIMREHSILDELSGMLVISNYANAVYIHVPCHPCLNVCITVLPVFPFVYYIQSLRPETGPYPPQCLFHPYIQGAKAQVSVP